MKVVSPKTLIVSIMLGIFVIYKILYIDDFIDILWIILLGNLVIQGLRVSFSREAYDKDIMQAYHKKVLYQRIFGRFAYIAADIPLIMIAFTGILACVCPVTSMLKVIISIFLAFSVIYAVFISAYISKHKRSAIKNGTYETSKLSQEDEKAWKISERCHNIFYFTLGAFMIFILFKKI